MVYNKDNDDVISDRNRLKSFTLTLLEILLRHKLCYLTYYLLNIY